MLIDIEDLCTSSTLFAIITTLFINLYAPETRNPTSQLFEKILHSIDFSDI